MASLVGHLIPVSLNKALNGRLIQVRDVIHQEIRRKIKLDEVMFVPDRLKTNAFRVLRLSVDATLSEVHKAVALFVIPIFPVGRYRVIDQGEKGYSFLGKLPFRKFDRWHLGIALTAIYIRA